MKPAKLAYTLEECAGALGKSERQVRTLIASGHIPAVKDGGGWVIPVWAAEQWLDQLVPRSTDRRTA